MMDANLLQALDHISPNLPRDDWFKVLAALKSEMGDSGYDVAKNWSMSGETYKEQDFNSTWNSAKVDGGIKGGTLIYMAKESGFQPSKVAAHNDVIQLNKQHIEESKQKAIKREEAAKQKQEYAALHCNDQWEQAQPVNPEHPYLTKKAVQAYGIKQEGNNLLIPMNDEHGRLMSLQTISPDGGKKFAKGARAKGLYHRIKGTGPIVICEGYATGASIHKATGYHVAVAFSCGNLGNVAAILRGKLPEVDMIIAADSQPAATLEKAREVAEAVNARLAVPTVDSDFNDMASAGYDIAEVFHHAPKPPKKGLVCIDANDFLQREFPPRECLLSPWLPKQGITMIHATRGTGKTHVSLGVAYAIASGGDFLGWEAEQPCGVLFIDGEMPANLLQERLAMIAASSDKDTLLAPLRILTPDMQEFGMPDLASMEGQQAIDQYVTNDISCIVVDNLATLVRSGKENESESWQPIQTWALIHRAKGRSVLFIHHSGKGGKQRGTSSREDVLDTVISLKHPSDYNPEDGAVFEVHFEKARGIYGDDVQPFEARLTTGEHGLQAWVTQSVVCRTYDKVVEMLQLGMTQKEIADELEVSKSTVSYHVKKAKQNGDTTGM